MKVPRWLIEPATRRWSSVRKLHASEPCKTFHRVFSRSFFSLVLRVSVFFFVLFFFLGFRFFSFVFPVFLNIRVECTRVSSVTRVETSACSAIKFFNFLFRVFRPMHGETWILLKDQQRVGRMWSSCPVLGLCPCSCIVSLVPVYVPLHVYSCISLQGVYLCVYTPVMHNMHMFSLGW